MKNLTLITFLIFLLSCTTDDDSNPNDSNLDANYTSNIVTRDPIVCQEITVGISWPLTLETVVYYCCPNEICIPTGGNTCPGCGITGTDPRSVSNYDNTGMRIHISDLIISQNNINAIHVNMSSPVEINNVHYFIKPGIYSVDNNDYIYFKFQKKS